MNPIIHNCPNCGGSIQKDVDKCGFCESHIHWDKPENKTYNPVKFNIGCLSQFEADYKRKGMVVKDPNRWGSLINLYGSKEEDQEV